MAPSGGKETGDYLAAPGGSISPGVAKIQSSTDSIINRDSPVETIFTIHSYLRWLVVLLIVLALVRLLMTTIRKGPFTSADRGLLSAAIGALDLQLLLGLILIIGWGAERFRIEHAVTMLIGIIIAHMTARYKKLDGADRARKSFILLLIATVFIVVGVMRLPGNGWTRSMHRDAIPAAQQAP